MRPSSDNWRSTDGDVLVGQIVLSNLSGARGRSDYLGSGTQRLTMPSVRRDRCQLCLLRHESRLDIPLKIRPQSRRFPDHDGDDPGFQLASRTAAGNHPVGAAAQPPPEAPVVYLTALLLCVSAQPSGWFHRGSKTASAAE